MERGGGAANRFVGLYGGDSGSGSGVVLARRVNLEDC